MAAVSGFHPSTSAPLFHNGPWPQGFALHLNVGGLPAVDLNATHFGLCGGMSFLTRDIVESGTPQLRNTTSTAVPMALADHLLTRLVDSFSAVVPQWLHKTQELDHSTWLGGPGLFSETVDEAHKVMSVVDSGTLCPIGVVLTQSWAPWDVFNNHVELVYAYDLSGSQLTLHVYDCNHQGDDTITIGMDISSHSPARTIATNGTSNLSQQGVIRGFFALPYTHRDPSPAYVDDGAVTMVTGPPSPMTPGQSAQVTVTLSNTGSTTWDPGAGYRLGTQSPQDNAEWGSNRYALPGSLDPEQHSASTFTVTAPAAAGTYHLQLRPVREGVRWFGSPTSSVAVGVGVTSNECAPLQAQYRSLEAQVAALKDELAQVDWSDPVAARHEAVILNARLTALTRQAHQVEQQLVALGCPPGG